MIDDSEIRGPHTLPIMTAAAATTTTTTQTTNPQASLLPCC
jgi:hypothetical protein